MSYLLICSSDHERRVVARRFTTSDRKRPAFFSAFFSAFLAPAVIPPGVGRHFAHEHISRGMKVGSDNAFEKPHGLLNEARLLLGRIGAGGDRRIDVGCD